MTDKTKIIRALQKLALKGAKIELVRGGGYWYFAYTMEATQSRRMVYDTESVYVMRLNDMSEERWIAEGARFVGRMNLEVEEA